jgi:hypothetical protein
MFLVRSYENDSRLTDGDDLPAVWKQSPIICDNCQFDDAWKDDRETRQLSIPRPWNNGSVNPKAF